MYINPYQYENMAVVLLDSYLFGEELEMKYRFVALRLRAEGVAKYLTS
jgi:hypothetical protein